MIFLPLTLTAEDAPRLLLTDAAVGKNLQAFATITLSKPAPEGGLEITLRTGDSNKLLLSRSAAEAGTGSLTLKLQPGMLESPEFWMQSLAGDGKVHCKASAAGYQDAAFTVSLTPSAVVVKGPYGGTEVHGFVGAPAVRMRLVSLRLEPDGKLAEEQLLRVPTLEVRLRNSNESAAKLVPDVVSMKIATSSAIFELQPSGEGEAIIRTEAPDGFAEPAEPAIVKASMVRPGLAISDHLTLGRDLQLGGVLSLGAPAPDAGASVVLTSSDPTRLLLSSSATRPGSGSITVLVPRGGASGIYFLQALGDSGSVTYTASGAEYRERTASVTLAPSGIVLTPASQGPPDEAQVLRSDPGTGVHTVSADLRKGSKTSLVAWTVQLDPVTHHAADITVQPLRAGLTVRIPLTSSEPRIARLPREVRIRGGSEHSSAILEALREGSTTITVGTPEGFTVPANSTAVVAIVGTGKMLRSEVPKSSVRTRP
ncbi:MAG: hypothetical protein ABJC09_03255 [Terriglobia bacterium]